MVIRRLIFVFSLCFSVVWSTSAFAQNYDSQGVSLSPGAKRLKRDFTTIIFSSLAGGILGLSTLSFYGQPQEHTVNITTGILLGLAGGLTYVVYNHTDYAEARPNQSAEEILPSRKRVQQSPTYLAFSWDFE